MGYAGGGGGASYRSGSGVSGSSVTDTGNSGQVNGGNGEAIISYQGPITTTTTTLASSANPSVAGQAVTYTATVSPAPDGGTVAFTDSGTVITGCGTQPVNTSTGEATCQVTYTSVGAHSITAAYSGDASFGASTSALTQTVNQAATTTAVSSSANPSTAGQSVTFTATVTANPPGAGTPTGTVTFADGSTTLGTATLNGSGTAAISTSALAPGSHNITASYGGDANFTGSTSAALTQTVSKVATATTVTSSANPSAAGGQVTYTATISPAPDGGTVAFTDGTTTIAGCGAQPVNTGTGTATCQVTYATAGTHAITAAYSGDATYAASTSAPLTQTVNKITTATTLSAAPNPSRTGTQVTYTATISPAPAGGTVAFTDNGSPVAGCSAVPVSAGTATCTTTPGTTGAHNITAAYSGTGAFAASTSTTVTQVVTSTPCASLAGCNLSGLNLTGAQLARANLTGANLNGANLTGANLTGATITATTNFNKVTWSNTTCPDGTNSNADGGTCTGHL